MDLHPTGTCFDDASQIFVELVYRFPLDRVRLVHGMTGDGKGVVGSHAWVEVTNDEGKVAVFTEGLMNGERRRGSLSRERFYEMLCVGEDVIRYTAEEALILDMKYGHCGPWEPRYRAATKDGR